MTLSSRIQFGLVQGLLFLFLFTLCQSRVYTNSFNVFNFRNNKGWNFLGRISAQPTQIALKLLISVRSKEVKPQAVFDIEIVAVPAQSWQEEIDKKCDLDRYNPEKLQDKSQKQISILKTIDQSGLYYATQRLIQVNQSTTYNFVMRDCTQSFLKQGLSRNSSLDVKLEVKNNQQHFAYNQFHNIWSLPLFVVLTYLVLYILKKDNDPQGDTWSKLVFKISLWSGAFSIIFKYSDYLIYAYGNGKHFMVLDVMYLLLHAFSDACLIFQVLFIAFGWTITFNRHKKFDIWIPISLIVAFVYIVVTVINKTRDSHHAKFHMFDTFAGYIMVAFRVLFYFIFIGGTIRSYLKLSSKHYKLKTFFLKFAFFGTAYLTFLPLAIILIQSVQQQKRHEYMALGLQMVRLLLNIWLAFLVGWKHSSYREVACNSFIQMENQKHF